MAVTFHNFTTTAGPASVGTKTLLFTATAGSVLLVWTHANTAVSISGIQANNVALTRLGQVSASSSRAELWGLTGPPAGVLSISANTVAAASLNFCLVATGYTGQRQVGGSPFGTVAAGTATGATANLSISSTSTDLVAFGFGASANLAVVLNNGTTRASATHSTTGRLVIGDIAGAATVSVSATANGAGTVWSMLGVPLIASATPTTSIVFDNAAVSGTSGPSNTFGLLLTATSNAVLLVFINTTTQVGGETISAVNVGTNQLTLLNSVAYHGRTQLWGLTAPPSGILTISAVCVGTNTVAWNMAAVTYTGHFTGAGGPFGGTAIVSAGAVTTATISVSSTAGNVVVMGFGNWMFDPVSFSVGSAFVMRAAPQQWPAVLVADTIGAPSITGSAQASSAVDWGVVGINLIQAGPNTNTSGIAAMTDAPDTFSATGYVVVRGSATFTDAPDRFTANARVIVRGSIAATDTPDKFTATAQVRVTGLLSATDTRDTFAASGYLPVRGSVTAVDTRDTFAAAGYVVVRGLISATDAPDVFFANGSAITNRSATIAATDNPDTFAATGYVVVQGLLAATDAADTFVALANNISESAAVVTSVIDTGAGGGKKRNDYIRAPDDFWSTRESYLKSLQPEMVESSEPAEVVSTIAASLAVKPSPQLLSYRLERQSVIAKLPRAESPRRLYDHGKRLRFLNAQIAEQKRLQLLAEQAAAERAAEAEKRRKRKLRRNLKRKVIALAAARALVALTHIYGKL